MVKPIESASCTDTTTDTTDTTRADTLTGRHRDVGPTTRGAVRAVRRTRSLAEHTTELASVTPQTGAAPPGCAGRGAARGVRAGGRGQGEATGAEGRRRGGAEPARLAACWLPHGPHGLPGWLAGGGGPGGGSGGGRGAAGAAGRAEWWGGGRAEGLSASSQQRPSLSSAAAGPRAATPPTRLPARWRGQARRPSRRGQRGQRDKRGQKPHPGAETGRFERQESAEGKSTGSSKASRQRSR